MKELGDLLLRRRFLIKADRMFKKPKPGRKRLVKWPKKLVPAEAPLVRACTHCNSMHLSSSLRMQFADIIKCTAASDPAEGQFSEGHN